MQRGLFFIICAIIMLCMAVLATQILQESLDPITANEFGMSFSAPINQEPLHPVQRNTPRVSNPVIMPVPQVNPDPKLPQASGRVFYAAVNNGVESAEALQSVISGGQSIASFSSSDSAALTDSSGSFGESGEPDQDQTQITVQPPDSATILNLDLADNMRDSQPLSNSTVMPGAGAVNSMPETAQSAAEDESAQTPASSEESRQSGGIVTKTSLPAVAGKNVITAATLTIDGESIALHMEGNAPLNARAFLMSNPDRVVCDVQGIWSIKAPAVQNNKMISGLRVGRQENAIRLVFDMLAKPREATVNQISNTVVELKIR